MNLDMGPYISPGPDITLALGGNEATHLSPVLTPFTYSDNLCPQEMNLSPPSP